MFNEKMFENVLQNQVSNKNLTSKTMAGYLRCIHQLEKNCRNKDGPSVVILEKAINKLCRENKQMNKYITAVKKYERDGGVFYMYNHDGSVYVAVYSINGK